MTHPVDPAVVQLIAAHHRAALIALSHEWKGDPNGCAGLAWGLRALDRVLLACDGETDPVKLGLAAAPPEPIEQAGLFEEGT